MTRVLTVIRLIGRGVRSHPLGSLLTLGACSFASCLFALALLAVGAAEKAASLPVSSGSMVAYVKEGVPRTRVPEMEKALRSLPQVRSFTFVPREKGLEKMRSWLGRKSPLVEDVDPEILPDAFEITLGREYAHRPEDVSRAVAAIPGIGDVRWRKGLIAVLASSYDDIAAAALALGASLGLTLGLVVFLSIRTSIASRSQEVAVMRTLGAPGSFIFAPYVVEGALYGALGAAAGLGAALALAGAAVVRFPVLGHLLEPDVYRLALAVILFGFACGVSSAALAASRSGNG
ncbi:MAG TPA: permease-like cell division protein FtsX [Deltaproteobacteria bacterium]|nr:permease-like cell division protein FtsX [Deltaproteobacteria bacterium]HPP79278.1 permease-like cell division protein FtsX [Deltaproteobacteria bacterium]